jgi:hypothetical protein
MNNWRYWTVHLVAHLYEEGRAICGYSVGEGNTSEAPAGMKKCMKCEAIQVTRGIPKAKRKK